MNEDYKDKIDKRKKIFIKIRVYTSIVWLWYYWLIVKRNNKIRADIDKIQFGQPEPMMFKSYFLKFCYGMNFQHEFIPVFYLRIGKIRMFKELLFWFYRQDKTVMIHMPEEKIGGGLMLGHGFSIIIIAESIGKNVSIFQQTTIGYSHGGCPIIGDNVWIYAGAKILGKIRIGNNAVIGANAVVTKDVPDNAVVVGAPGRVIRIKKEGEFLM